MADTFFFYDLETSGTDPKKSRIMQFAGQRTDMDLNPVGEPYNILVKLSEDILPEPDAVMVTGITPQMTLSEGITEAEFFKFFHQEIVADNTIFVGYNSVRFDDEFIRYGLYRNFYDAYEWQWKNACSRWDMLDVVRMTRALRPEKIKWPFTVDGKPTNRLELITKENGLDHDNAHDALNDVNATIAVAKLIKSTQPRLFEYLLKMRGKKEVEKFIRFDEPFVYVSGMYPSEFEKMCVVLAVGLNDRNSGAFVYDLRHDPAQFLDKTPEELAELMRWKRDITEPRLPVKTLTYNKCPAVAPLGVLRPEDIERLKINVRQIEIHRGKILERQSEFHEKLLQATSILRKESNFVSDKSNPLTADGELYDGFVADKDKQVLAEIHKNEPDVESFTALLQDERLKILLPLYKARNFPKSLTESERREWESHKERCLQAQLPAFIQRLEELSVQSDLPKSKQYLVEELRLFAESIMPVQV